MKVFLHLQIATRLTPAEFRERVAVPLRRALEREGLGTVLDDYAGDEYGQDGGYELALEVTDERRARDVAEAVLNSVDGGSS